MNCPAKEAVTIPNLPKNCRIPEMEFLLGKSRDWVHGYMDLVFRLEKSGKTPLAVFRAGLEKRQPEDVRTRHH